MAEAHHSCSLEPGILEEHKLYLDFVVKTWMCATDCVSVTTCVCVKCFSVWLRLRVCVCACVSVCVCECLCVCLFEDSFLL